MSDERLRRFLLLCSAAAASAAIAYLTLRYFLRWVFPFLLAFFLATALEPVIVFLQHHLRLRRSFSAAVLTLFFLFIAGGLLSLLLSTLAAQASGLLAQLPRMLADLPALVAALFSRLEAYCALCPPWLQDYISHTVAVWVSRSSAAVDALAARLLSALPSLAAALPRFALTAATTVLAVFYTSTAYPTLRKTLREKVSLRSRKRLRLLRSGATRSLLHWLRAELTLSLITFFQLLLGFHFLRQEFSLLLAVIITVFDALPVFGVGGVLLPWAAAALLFGSTAKGLILLALYLCILLVRSVLEPKLVARHSGLPPIASLAAMYLGFCTFGVGGMIFFPFLLLFAAQLFALHREDAPK